MTIVHADPVQLPRLRPICRVESGAADVNVAVTVPPAVAVKGYVTPPFMLRVPVNVSVTVAVVVAVVVGVVGVVAVVLLLHPATLVASASSRIPGSKRRISSP